VRIPSGQYTGAVAIKRQCWLQIIADHRCSPELESSPPVRVTSAQRVDVVPALQEIVADRISAHRSAVAKRWTRAASEMRGVRPHHRVKPLLTAVGGDAGRRQFAEDRRAIPGHAGVASRVKRLGQRWQAAISRTEGDLHVSSLCVLCRARLFRLTVFER